MDLDVRALADTLGYPAAALGVLIEYLGLPFSGEITLVAAAAYAAGGHLDIRLVALAAGIGAMLSGDLGYLVGYRGGRPFVERFSRLVRVDAGQLARAEMFFTRTGAPTVFLARFLPGLRAWVSILAGMAHMPFWTFQLYSAVGDPGRRPRLLPGQQLGGAPGHAPRRGSRQLHRRRPAHAGRPAAAAVRLRRR
jgi:membrane protein DedA with SNARE-associated domain